MGYRLTPVQWGRSGTFAEQRALHVETGLLQATQAMVDVLRVPASSGAKHDSALTDIIWMLGCRLTIAKDAVFTAFCAMRRSSTAVCGKAGSPKFPSPVIYSVSDS